MRNLRPRSFLFLLVPLIMALGCGSDPLPPGGTAAVEYWHRVLHEFPDLPAKVQAIVDGRGRPADRYYDLPATEIRIYGEEGVVTFSASRVELVVTDLNTKNLQDLLAIWKAIPDQAAELGLSTPVSPFGFGGRRKVVVLGSQGRIDIRGVDQQNTQSIRILTDEVAAQTTIGIHTFGPSGQQALEELARNYQAVRGPPSSDVRSGYVSLPPPDEALSVLVIGQLQTLNIEGAYGDATQQISLAAYVNGHQSADGLMGTPAGTPFAERLARNAQVASPSVDTSPAAYAEPATLAPARPAVPVAVPVRVSSPGTSDYSRGYNPQTIELPRPVEMPRPIELPKITPWVPPQPVFTPVIVPQPVFKPTPVTSPVRFR